MCDKTQTTNILSTEKERERDVDDLIFQDEREWLASDR